MRDFVTTPVFAVTIYESGVPFVDPDTGLQAVSGDFLLWTTADYWIPANECSEILLPEEIGYIYNGETGFDLYHRLSSILCMQACIYA